MQKARQKSSIAAAAFEALESRQMMSVSIAPSGGNDTAALQSAINSTPAGTTINLEAGTYHVSSMLNMDGHTIQGIAGQTTLQWTGASNSYLINTGSNSELEGVTVNGAGIQLTDSSSNVTITNDTIENTGAQGISGQGGSNNLEITHNTVQNIGGYGMVLYSINQAHVDYNTITNIYEGIHAVNFLGTNAGNNCTFNYNTVTGITRHGIEIQNDWDNLSVGWNYVANFNVQPGGNSHMALSIATGPGAGGAVAENVDIHDNVLLGTGPGIPSNPNYCFTAIEIMGDGSIVQNNFMANWGWTVLDGFTSNWQVKNNTCVDITSMNGKDALPESNGVAPSVDTGNTYASSWNGSVPSAFADAGADGTGSGASVSTPTASAVAAPINLTATSPNSNEIDVKWTDQTGGAATYTIQIKSTYGNDPYVTVATVPAGATSYNIEGLNPNWWYNITVTATVNGQNSTAAVVQDEVMPPGSSTVSSTPVVSTTGKSSSGSTGSKTKTSTTSGGTKSDTGSKSSTGSQSSGSTETKPSSGSSTTSVSSDTGSTAKAAKKAASQAAKVAAQAAKAAKQAELSAKKAAKGVSSTPTTVVAAAPGHGLVATFTKGSGAKKVVASEVTANVNYTLSGKSKSAPSLSSPVGASNYNVVWTGEVEPPTSGTYRISTSAEDDMRVWIDGKKVVGGETALESRFDGGAKAIKLVAGEKYDIKVKYVQKKGAATAQLLWATKGTVREVIPDEDLYLPAAA
jgi:hypothetical protein